MIFANLPEYLIGKIALLAVALFLILGALRVCFPNAWEDESD